MFLRFRKQQGGNVEWGRPSYRAKRSAARTINNLILSGILAVGSLLGGAKTANVVAQSGGGGKSIYLPAVQSPKPPPPSTTVIHIPYFGGDRTYDDHYSEMAVVWFGRVSPLENYTHLRMGYNAQQLSFEVNTYDRDLWYDEHSPSPAEISQWDGVSIYLMMPANPKARLLRFDAQLSTIDDNRAAYQAAYEYTNSGWTKLNIAFTTIAAHLGEGINGPLADKGWIINYEIPFASLGLSGRPADQSEWKMGARIYDQNSGPGGPTIQQVWPGGFNENSGGSYANVTFGYKPLQRTTRPAAGSVAIKQGGSVNVPDGSVGGYSTCGGGYDYWSEWGNVVYNSGYESQVTVIQNQRDVSDFPCFSRYYITFPLQAVPRDKVVVSAKLTLYQFGNSDPSGAIESYIHVFRIKDDWRPETLTWNNSPAAYENYPGIWVDPLPGYPGEPGIARTWDVTQALTDTLQSGDPSALRLALQSADWAMHSGKYFWASEIASQAMHAEPVLVVQWANP